MSFHGEAVDVVVPILMKDRMPPVTAEKLLAKSRHSGLRFQSLTDFRRQSDLDVSLLIPFVVRYNQIDGFPTASVPA
jgi:hypothetical protein